jgi:hypothetical protein
MTTNMILRAVMMNALILGLCTGIFSILAVVFPGIALADAAPSVQTIAIENPLKDSISSLPALITAILNIFKILMIPVIVFFIILSGFKYVTAQGNPGQIEEATTSLTYAVIGGVLVLAAVAIAEIIKNTVASFSA